MSSKLSRTIASTIPANPVRRNHHFKMVCGLWFLEVGSVWSFDMVTVVAPTWQECWKIYTDAQNVPTP